MFFAPYVCALIIRWNIFFNLISHYDTIYTHLIDEVRGRTDIFKAKPNPKALVDICEALGVDLKDTVMVGDHPMDLACAQAAEIQFIGILGGSSSEETLKNAGSKRIAKNLVDLETILLENGE